MSFVRCSLCGEVADRGLVRHCPGCGNVLPRLRADRERLRIPKAQRQAGQDGVGANLVLALLGLMVLGNGVPILSQVLGLPTGVSAVLALIAFATLFVSLRSPERTGELLSGKGQPGEFVKEIGSVVVRVIATILIAAFVIFGGLTVLVYVICAGMGIR